MQKIYEMTFQEHIDNYKLMHGEFAETNALQDLMTLFRDENHLLSTCEPFCNCQSNNIHNSVFINHLNYSTKTVLLPLQTEYTESSASIDTLSHIVFENASNAINHPLCWDKLKYNPPAHFVTPFKYHISIQNFSNTIIGQTIKLGQFLKEKSATEKHLNFFFKMVSPPNLQKKLQFIQTENITRFLNYDQFTLYFNPFSSLGAILRLADDVEQFLLDSGYQASPPNGYKDIITINPFLSARNDGIHNKNSYHYGYLEFFDHECKKFIDTYREELKASDNLPIGAFEIILLICLAIPNLSVSENQEISEEHSQIVQDHFKMLKENPKEFISKASQIIKDLKSQQNSAEEDHYSLSNEDAESLVDDEDFDTFEEKKDSEHIIQRLRDQQDSTEEDHFSLSHEDDLNNDTLKENEDADVSDVIIKTQNLYPEKQSPSLISTSLFKGVQVTSALGLSTMGILFCFNIVISNPISLPIGIIMLILGACLLALLLRNEIKNYASNPVQSNGII